MDVLKAYWDKIGGKPQAKPKTPAKKGTKRKSMAQITPEPDATSTTKRRERKSLKTADEPDQVKTPSLPEGSWEDHVQAIDVVEKPDSGVNRGVLMVYLLWEDDSRTQHTAQQCRQKCPQKVNLYLPSAIYHLLTCNS
jgi:chromobox protein 1